MRAYNLLPKTAIILANGSKAHHSKITYNRPRTMLPAAGKPIVVRVMDRLYRIGIRNYIVILGEKEGGVANYLNRRWMPDINLKFIIKLEGHLLGQILCDIAAEHNEAMFIAGYNSFTHGLFPDRLRKYHSRTPDSLIIAGAKNSLSSAPQKDYVQVLPAQPDAMEADATADRPPAERMNAITAEPQPNGQNLNLINFAVAGTDFIAFLQDASTATKRAQRLIDICKHYMDAGGVARMARTSWVLQIEADNDLIALNRHLLDEQIDANILSEIPYTAQIKPPIRIDPGVSVGQGATIGPHVYLEGGSSVGRNTTIQNSIVLQDAIVPAQQHVSDVIYTTRGPLKQT